MLSALKVYYFQIRIQTICYSYAYAGRQKEGLLYLCTRLQHTAVGQCSTLYLCHGPTPRASILMLCV